MSMRPHSCAAWAAASVLFLAATPLSAQTDEGGAPGITYEEENADTGSSSPVARFLQEGIQYYNQEDFISASIFFWRVINDTDPAADSLRPRAQYELAKTLIQMRLLQGALVLFDEIIAEGSAHPYFEASAPWMILIARRLPGDSEMLRRVNAFAEVFPDRIEEKYRDEMAFYLGQHAYNTGELETALQYLEFVTPVSSFYPEALFLSAITSVRQYDAAPAVDKLISLMVLVEEDRGNEQMQALGELARLTMARTFYSTGEYDKAIRYYRQIEQGSRYWLDALFESSWAYFQLDEYNRALGNLHSLNSPFFNDQYYPEAPILQAVTFFYNCRFEEARLTLEEFDYVYAPLREELEEATAGLDDNIAYWDFLMQSEGSQGRDFDPRLQQIVNATLSDRSVQNARAFVEELEREVRYIDEADPGWANSELATYLYQEIAGALDLSRGEAGRIVRTRMDTILDELRRKENDAQAILIEADLAEVDPMTSDFAQEFYTGPARDITADVTSEQMVWTFDGEYWRDELGNYFYHISSACE